MKTSSFYLNAVLLSLCLALAACSSTPSGNNGLSGFDNKGEGSGIPPRQQIALWLEQADSSEGEARQALQLKAAKLLVQEKQLVLAEELLTRIDSENQGHAMAAHLALSYALTKASLHRNYREHSLALQWLNKPTLQNALISADLSLQLAFSVERAKIYAQQGEHLQAAKERMFIAPMLDSRLQEENREAIWRALSLSPMDALAEASRNSRNPDEQAWFELANIAQGNQGDIDTQLRQLEDWQRRWINHPAAHSLPGGLDQIAVSAKNRAQHIALLLPVSGRLANYGKAVRDGFIAALFEHRQSGGQVPSIRAYNSAEGNILDIYQQALNDGAELIIGPLDKAQVRQLAEHYSEMPVATLALNHLDELRAPAQLYQFGLNPNDEAEQIARIAHAEGHSKALMLLPQGSRGQLLGDHFAQAWRSLGGEIIETHYFNARKNDYSAKMKALLNLDDSNTRATLLRRNLGTRFEFEPYRRDDIDMLFVVAKPKEARSIKPLMAFHYAGDIPVYSISRAHQGKANPSKDKDLNGLRFTEIPWLLDNDDPLQTTLKRLPQQQQLQRMHALGVDSYRLYPRLNLLQSIPNSRVYGGTGTLQINAEGKVLRELQLAQFKRGRAVNIPMLDAADTEASTRAEAAM